MSSNDEIGIRSSGGGSKLGQPDDGRPLSDSEYQLVQRLFSDPFSFPLEFKSWLVGYLEMSDMTLPMSSVIGLQQTLGISGAGEGTLGIFPAGLILAYGGQGSPPPGSLFCDGAAYTTSSQTRLFQALGYTYGGSGSVFNVPDLRGRTLVGTNVDVAELAGPGRNDGLPSTYRRVRHNHTVTTAPVGWSSEGITAGGDAQVPGVTQTNEVDVHTHATTVGVGLVDGQPAPTDGAAFMAVNYIIVS